MKLIQIAPNATVVHHKDGAVLFSYQTPVAAFVPGQGYLRTSGSFSTTTSRHINKWLGATSVGKKVDQAEIENLVNKL